VQASFLDRLASGPLLADGAMATQLQALGVPPDCCFEELNLSRPALVGSVHRAYTDAGACLLFSNSFGANRFRLRGFGLQNRVREINAAAVAVAREAIGAAADFFVAGDVGPLGVRLAPYGRVQAEVAQAAFREQMAALCQAGADLLAIETMVDLREIALAVRTAHEVGRLPVIAMMTFTRDDRTLLGDDATTVARDLVGLGADVIGVNCSGGPAQAMRLLAAMQRAQPGARFAVKPNAGWPERVGGRVMYPASPDYFGDYAAAFAEAGALVIGGCCGTTPQHIAAMRAALEARPRAPLVPRAAGPAARGAEQRPVAAPRTRLQEKLARGQFVIGVEMDPPRGLSTHKLLAGAHLLAEAGADVINVADSPMARMRMSAWAVCHLIESEVGTETVLHFPLRGRNVLRLQGDLLAAHALGLRNVFVVMGDPTSIGDYPTALSDSDLVPSGLIRLIKRQLNRGVDHAGAAIGEPTSFFVGCAVNLGAADADAEMKNLRRKVRAGADFALTQPVYDLDPARAFLRRYAERYGSLSLPLLVGVLPLYNARHAAFLHNEVPGIVIPESLRARIAAAGTAAAAEGVCIALELIGGLRDVAQGVYLMPPFNRYDMAAEIIERMRNGVTKPPSPAPRSKS
jgi:methionine synthase I (cobalamin-dependent)/5,10-methylenetetrahydrofolate reductase